MPHSSGGFSSGGGFHSGGSSGGSSNHVSTHYFPGAIRYRRYYSDGRPDDYIYANSKPGKTTFSSVIMIAVVGLIFTLAAGFSAFTDTPRFIVPKYSDAPAIHDTVGVFEETEENELLAQMKIYNQTTGICPVIYTVFDEEWNREYESLAKYAFDKYVENFKDEQHFVIFYSIPAGTAVFTLGGGVTSKEFKVEATQGDETDPLITDSVYRRFCKIIQNGLEAGNSPGKAFIAGFENANESAEKMLDPMSPARIFRLITRCVPFLICLGIFIPLIIVLYKNYRKDKAMSFEEVPLDVEPVPVPGLSTFTNGKGGTVTVNKGPGYYERSVHYDASTRTAGKVIKFVSLAVIIPFILVGIGVTVGGISILKAGNDRNGGIFMILFGIAWTIISLSSFISMFVTASKTRKEVKDPLTAEYPKVEYPDMQPLTPENPEPAVQTEFDPQFFGSSKSDYESDDEDYKRMKRQGYE